MIALRRRCTWGRRVLCLRPPEIPFELLGCVLLVARLTPLDTSTGVAGKAFKRHSDAAFGAEDGVIGAFFSAQPTASYIGLVARMMPVRVVECYGVGAVLVPLHHPRLSRVVVHPFRTIDAHLLAGLKI